MGATRDGTNDDAGAAGGQPTYEELSAENRRLKAQIQKLLLLIEKLRRESSAKLLRFASKTSRRPSRKRQAASRAGATGRMPHRAVPPRIDESYEVALPQPCPRCGDGRVRETHIAQQYQAEIPRTVIYRRFDVHVGVCAHCGHTVQGRHALQTSMARGAAGSQLGANVHAVLAIMNKQLGLSHGKSVKLLSTLFEGLTLARHQRPLNRADGRAL